MRGIALGVMLLVTGCNDAKIQAVPDVEARHQREYPVGRFQMAPAGDFATGEPQIVVLDTRFGKISRCTIRAGGPDCVAARDSGH